jgi:signal transduction histidine kinase
MSGGLTLAIPSIEPAALERRSRQRWPFLSTSPAGPRERALAFGVLLVSCLVFAAAAPFARHPLPQVPAFLPLYQSALVCSDLMTAVLLFGQFSILRWNALLLLGGAYVFSALMAVAHALSFPGLFAPSGLLGAGPQTTAWIYFLWHAVFPLVVILYATRAHAEAAAGVRAGSLAPMLLAIGGAAVAAALLTALAVSGGDALPQLMQGSRDAPGKLAVAAVTWTITLAALPALWRRRPLTVLDLWLMVVMVAWVFEVALAAVLNGARYDLGWYAGRVYGFLAASFVLGVLLLENGRLYAQLAASRDAERRRAQEALAHHAERLRIMHEIDRAIVTREAPERIAGAVIQPLRLLLGVPRAIVNIFDLEKGEAQWLAAAGRHRVHVGGGVRFSIRMMGDVDALRRGEPQRLDTSALPPGPAVDALLASGVRHYMAVPMIAAGELLGALSFGGETADFPEEQVAIAREIATQLAIVMSQARLLDRLHRHAEDLEQRVQARTAELQAANKELESFTYSVSHDLRAPLRAVDGYALMLEEDHAASLDAEGRRLLGVVRGEAARMGQLIDDLLAFSRTGRQPLQAAKVDMAGLVREVLGALSAEHPRARVEVGALPPCEGDRAMLRQVWVNLIGNALKYSGRRPEPRVEVGGAEEAGQTSYWVRDNGAGFDPRYAHKLFGVFQRLHGSDEFTGTGVGLAIVQRVVLRHGGRVRAEGAPQAGATFGFSLPRRGGGA